MFIAGLVIFVHVLPSVCGERRYRGLQKLGKKQVLAYRVVPSVTRPPTIGPVFGTSVQVEAVPSGLRQMPSAPATKKVPLLARTSWEPCRWLVVMLGIFCQLAPLFPERQKPLDCDPQSQVTES